MGGNDMTIDEAIKMYKKIANADAICPRYCMRPCEDCVQECKQIANWLEELKSNRIALEKANGYLEVNHRLGYNKAIDDFVREFKRKTPMENCLIDELAEQLKAGGKNE